jgi:F0F1-type ATP synthase assembly protein I
MRDEEETCHKKTWQTRQEPILRAGVCADQAPSRSRLPSGTSASRFPLAERDCAVSASATSPARQAGPTAGSGMCCGELIGPAFAARIVDTGAPPPYINLFAPKLVSTGSASQSPAVTEQDDDRSPFALASEWTARITTVSLELVLPILAGVWLDQWLHLTPLFLILGVILGFATATMSLVWLTKPPRRPPPSEHERDEP